jgi:hypothetical protein
LLRAPTGIRRTRAIAALVGVMLVTACGSDAPASPTVPTGLVAGRDSQSLQFGSGIDGTMVTTTAESCTDSFTQQLHTLDATIVGPVAGAPYGVYLRIRYVGGDSTYRLGQTDSSPTDPRDVTLQVGRQQNTPTPTWDAVSGTVTVDSTGEGGTIAAVLRSSAADHPTTTVSGQWRCSAAAPTGSAPAAQHLRLTGALSGGFAGPHLPQAARFARASCSTGSAFNLTVIGSPDDLPKIFSITVVGYHGPGTYREHVDGSTVSVELIPGYGDADTRSWALPEPPTVAVGVDAGEHSGSVDAELVAAPPGSPNVHVTGTWACA